MNYPLSPLLLSNWLYDKREPLSFSATALLSILALVIYLMPSSKQETLIATTEMIAFLETPMTEAPKIEKQVIKKDPEIIKKIEKTQTKSNPKPENKIQENPTESSNSQVPQEASSTKTSRQSSSQNDAQASSSNVTPSSKASELGPSLSAKYEAILRAYIEKIKRYPTSREARLSRPEGIVKIWLELNRAGELIAVGISNSSGFNLLDNEAIKTLRGGNFPAFPEGAFSGESSHKFLASMKYTISAANSLINDSE